MCSPALKHIWLYGPFHSEWIPEFDSKWTIIYIYSCIKKVYRLNKPSRGLTPCWLLERMQAAVVESLQRDIDQRGFHK